MRVEDYAVPSGAGRAAGALGLIATVVLATTYASAAESPASRDERTQAGNAIAQDRETLRYAGRGFDDWRDQLLNDLDPKTCMQAMPPMAAFGKRGYQEEAIAALASMLHDDRFDVAMEASQTLGQIGPKAVAALTDGLADGRPQVRMRAAQTLGRLGPDAKPATDALVSLLNDRQDMVRAAVTQSLLMVAADDDSLHPTFQRLAASDDVLMRRALVDGLKANPPHGGPLLRLLIRAVDDDDLAVRSTAGPTLAQCGPPDPAVIDALRRLLGDNDPRNWQTTLSALGNPGNTTTKAKVLADVLTSADDFAHLRGQMVRVINLLGGARDEAETVVPPLTALIERKAAGLEDPVSVAAAIDALGRIGPAAKRAVPALERWIFDEQQVALGNGDSLEKHARAALRKIVGTEAEAE
jgi:HEAT repeat protein